MRYTRSQINKSGQIIVSPMDNVLAYAEAMSMVDDWRKLHLPVLEQLVKQVSVVFSARNIPVTFTAQRLKRMPSIINKLRRTPQMGLGGVQDIGGARFAFDNMESLLNAKACLEQTALVDFTLDHDIYDYVAHPKASGYRSIHFVYKYHSSDNDLDGMRVELQLRTTLQHSWATAVETAELISNSPIKSGQGDEAWQNFFCLVSSIFARQENQPVDERFKTFTNKDYCESLARQDSEYKFWDNLQALVGLVRVVEEQEFAKGYVLLVIDYWKKEVQLRHFVSEQKDEVNQLYAQIENKMGPEQGAVVLVAVDDVNELRMAYPSYFLNAQEFLNNLDKFRKFCQTIEKNNQ